MILLDTCILIFDALTPERLSAPARRAIEQAEATGALACADISLWEIAMLIAKGRLDPGTGCESFIADVLASRGIQVLPITAAIAATSSSHPGFEHADPADRIIAATAMTHHAPLLTSDARLLAMPGLATIW